MYNITFLYLGAPTERFYREALDEYEKRLGRFCRFTEKCLKPEPLSSSPSEKDIARALAAEKAKITAAFPKNAYKIALCIEGKPLSSEELAETLERLPRKGRFRYSSFLSAAHTALTNPSKKSVICGFPCRV